MRNKLTFNRIFIISFGILSLANIIATIFAYLWSVDWGFWPVAFYLYEVIAAVYSAIYAFLTVHIKGLATRYSIVFNGILGLYLIADAFLFYHLTIDWFGINSGQITLTKFQSFIQSPLSIYGVMGLFLIIQFLVYLFYQGDKRIT